jgi:hypothetical protein
MKGMWPAEIMEFRDRHLRSDAHAMIMCIAQIEVEVKERFGVEADCESCPSSVRKFASLSLVRAFADSEDQKLKLAMAIDDAAAEFKARSN